MGFLTNTAKVWYPAVSDKMQLHTLFSTMASSIENGIGSRLTKLESFVGANVCLPSGFNVPTSGNPVIIGFTVNQVQNFTSGVTLNSDGSLQIVTPGMYTIAFNANFLPATTTAPKIVTYLYKNGSSVSYGGTYGEAVSGRFSNCNIGGVYKFVAGDVITARVICADASATIQPGGGTNISIALTSRS